MATNVELIEKQITELRKQLLEARRAAGAMEVKGDYTFTGRRGEKVTLGDLFAGKPDLVLIHNMGKRCPYCTLWADGFVGFAKHMENRAGFALVSPDEPKVMDEFASSRGWPYRVVSSAGSTFTKDMGFEPEPGKHHPGVSTFSRGKDGKVRRVACAHFGPGDDFCAIWHIFDLLDGGAKHWEPKYGY